VNRRMHTGWAGLFRPARPTPASGQDVPPPDAVAPAPWVFGARFDSGAVLLDAKTGRFHSLDDFGADIWQTLTNGGALHTTVDAVARRFGIGRDRVGQDAVDFVGDLWTRGVLVDVRTDGAGGSREEVTLAAEAHAGASAPSSRPSREPRHGGGGEGDGDGDGDGDGVTQVHPIADDVRASAWRRVLGAVALAVAFVLLRALSLYDCHRLVSALRRHRRAAPRPDLAAVARWVVATRPAGALRSSALMCMEHSLASVLLARLAGHDVAWCIGVDRSPFTAHAWVAVAGRPVGDAKATECTVILRG